VNDLDDVTVSEFFDTPSSPKQTTEISLRSHPKLARFPRPDVTQMILWKADSKTGANLGVSGAPVVCSLPEILGQFALSLPSVAAYEGPTVNVDGLISTLRDIPVSLSEKDATKKRRIEEDDDEELAMMQVNLPPAKDLFRTRQAAKISKQKTSTQ